MRNPVFNNFNFDNDKNGGKCPIQGHIRKVNPRGKSRNDQLEERKHRIARRGILYGKRKFDLSDHPEKGVGLLFMCFQADIAKQFEHLQKMANATTGGLDPIIGQTANKKTPLQQQWPSDWAGEGRKTKAFNFQGFVTLQGGEYFFAPSISFLRRLK
jgi:deferrochelatase/peroxidase EfeB